MSIISLMLYGSCARGDNKSDSDVDVLALHEDSYYKMTAQNKLNIVYYSRELLSERMKAGNIFCLHLVKEGKIIYDIEKTLEKILKIFTYKEDYFREIKEASELAWVLTKFFNHFDNYFYLNKKLAWCFRTIIICNSAQLRQAVFSKSEMLNFIDDKSYSPILEAKNSSKFEADNIKLMRTFLANWGTKKPDWLEDINSINDAQQHFEENSYAKYVTKTFKEIGYTL